MKTTIKLIIFLLFLGGSAKAQVGINTLTPDTNAILHIYSNSKGVLLPEVDSGSRKSIPVDVAANGLLVYDSEDGVYYFFNKDSKEWLALNAFRATDVKDNNGLNDVVKLSPKFESRNVIIGSGNADASAKLQVMGNIKAKDTVLANNAKIASNIGTKTLSVSDKVTTEILSVADSIWSKKIGATNINANNISGTTVNVTTLNAERGNGIIPLGSIVMWSGSTPPTGWAICNGQVVNGYTTPDLQGRFIVGYGTAVDSIADNSYKNAGNLSRKGTQSGRTGGLKEVTLTIEQMPEHDHNIPKKVGDGGVNSEGHAMHNNIHDLPTSKSGGGQAHENRPPYYVLAFIMRVQ